MSGGQDQEGWGAPVRAPLIAAASLLAFLLVALTLTGRLYVARVRPLTRAPLGSFPTPRLETAQTPPHQPRADFRQPPPRRIDRAMARTAAEGDALWGNARP